MISEECSLSKQPLWTASGEHDGTMSVNLQLRKTRGELRRHLPPPASIPRKVGWLILALGTTLKATVVGWGENSERTNGVIHSKDCRDAVHSRTKVPDKNVLQCRTCLFPSCRCGRYRPGLLRLPPPHSLLWADKLCPNHKPRGTLCCPGPPTRERSGKWQQLIFHFNLHSLRRKVRSEQLLCELSST